MHIVIDIRQCPRRRPKKARRPFDSRFTVEISAEYRTDMAYCVVSLIYFAVFQVSFQTDLKDSLL